MKFKRARKLKRKQLASVASSLKKRKYVRPERLAEYLRFRTPASERWFQQEWRRLGRLHIDDLFNRPFCGYLPDCINQTLGYVIEIDGEIHELAEVREKDAKKDEFYRSKGLLVFRIRSFDRTQLQAVANAISELSTKEG